MSKGNASDCNAHIDTGIYQVSGTPSNSPVSDNAYGILFVVRNFYTMQIFAALVSPNLTPKYYIRIMDEPNNIFGSWKEL